MICWKDLEGWMLFLQSSQAYVQMLLKSPIRPRSILWDLKVQSNSKVNFVRFCGLYKSPNLQFIWISNSSLKYPKFDHLRITAWKSYFIHHLSCAFRFASKHLFWLWKNSRVAAVTKLLSCWWRPPFSDPKTFNTSLYRHPPRLCKRPETWYFALWCPNA